MSSMTGSIRTSLSLIHISGQDETPEILAEQVGAVTVDRVVEAMERVTLDTVYFLKGKGDAQ